MRIDRIEIENVNRIARIDLDLSSFSPVTLISGNNGSGKTSLITAIPWGLFGEDVLERSKECIIRDGESSCRVKLWLSDPKTGSFTVERTRSRSGSVSLYLDGKKGNTVTGTQKIIEGRLGFDHALFMRTVVFAGDQSSFCSMTPAQRLALFEQMLGIEVYLKASGVARERLRGVRAEIESTVDRRNAHYAAMEEIGAEFKDSLDNLSTVLAGNARRLSELRENHMLAHKRLEKAENRLSDLRKSVVASVKAHELAVQSWEASLAEARAKRTPLEKDRREASRDLGAAQALKSQAQAMLDDISKKTGTRICPTCRRTLPVEDSHEHLKAMIETTRRELEVAIQAVKGRSARADQAEQLVLSCDAAISKVEQSRPKPPKETREIEKQTGRVGELRTKIRSIQSEIARIEEEDAGSWHYTALVRSISKFLHKAVVEVADESKMEEYEKRAALLEYWSRAFSKDGLPAAVLESVAPSLDKLVHPISEILTAGAYAIRFVNVVSETSGRSSFQVEASNVDGGSMIHDLSVGERLRVDLCVLFAIRSFMQAQTSIRFDQIFIDEMFDKGIDDVGLDAVIRLLRSRQIAPQVFFISHRSSLKEAAESVILVEKKNGVTTLVNQRKGKTK